MLGIPLSRVVMQLLFLYRVMALWLCEVVVDVCGDGVMGWGRREGWMLGIPCRSTVLQLLLPYGGDVVVVVGRGGCLGVG